MRHISKARSRCGAMSTKSCPLAHHDFEPDSSNSINRLRLGRALALYADFDVNIPHTAHGEKRLNLPIYLRGVRHPSG